MSTALTTSPRFFLQTYNVLEAEKACVGEYNRTVYGKLLLVILYLPILICADFSVKKCITKAESRNLGHQVARVRLRNISLSFH